MDNINKYNSFLIIAMIGFLFLSCTNNNKDDIFLRDNIKDNAKSVKIDTISLSEDLIYAKEYFIYQDSILIVLNNKYEDQYFVEIYNRHQNKLINKYYRLGNGPNEMLSALVQLNGSALTVNDYVKGQVAFLNMDSILTNPSYLITPLRHFTNSSVVDQHLNEDQLISGNVNCFSDENLGIENKVPRFILTNKKCMSVENQEWEYITMNVSAGLVIVNYDLKKIAYASMYKSIIEFYDKDLKLGKRIIGPDKLIAKYVITDREVIFSKYIPFSYLRYCTDDDCFYVTYMGDNLIAGKNMVDYPLWIFKFDWDGNFITSYNVGQYISSISIGNDSKSFYATGYMNDKSVILLKITMQ